MLLLFEMGNIVKEDQALYFITAVVIAVIIVVGEEKKVSSVLDILMFKVTCILQVEIGTRQLRIWVQIPEESSELKIKMSEYLAEEIEIEFIGMHEIT